jgi:hypothetical protein
LCEITYFKCKRINTIRYDEDAQIIEKYIDLDDIQITEYYKNNFLYYYKYYNKKEHMFFEYDIKNFTDDNKKHIVEPLLDFINKLNNSIK